MNYFIIAFAGVFVGVGCAVHSQISDLANPSGPVHPGTAILDSMDIGTGDSQSSTQAPIAGPVHPGTAILDSMGIFAGEPARASPVNGNVQAATAAKRN